MTTLETALAVLAAAEAVALVVLAVLFVRQRAALVALQQRLDTRQSLLDGGREAVKTVWNTASVLRREGLGAVVRNSIEELAEWAEVERPDLARLAPDGRVVLLFSDIENSTAMNEDVGDRAWVKLLGRHEKLVRRHVKRQHGHVVKTQGDGFMIAFADPAQAVRCATGVQRDSGRGGGASRRIRVRIGIHMGKSVRRGDDVFGRNVAMAARVADQAGGGEILLSEAVRDAVAGDGEVTLGEAREVTLKGLRGEHRLFPVDA